MTKKLTQYLPLIIPAGLVLLVDQATKAWVRARLRPGQVLRPDLPISQTIRITHAQNFGGAWGIFQGLSDMFMFIALAISLGVLFYYPRIRPGERLLRLSLGLLLGGGLGNLLDRLLQGYVLDFISINGLPSFNPADLAILIGAIGLAVGIWRHDEAKSTGQPGASPQQR